MKRSVIFSGLVVALLTVLPAQAQLPGISVGLGGGPTFPTGDLGDLVDPGFHVQGVASLNLPLIPIGIRANLDYHQMSAEMGGNNRQLFGNVNGTVEVPLVPLLLTGYFTGGLGMYHSRFSGTLAREFDLGNATNAGVNFGAGVQLGLVLIDLFLETRYHHVFGGDISPSFVPVTFGIMF